METVTNNENTSNPNGIECAIIDWADAKEVCEAGPPRLPNRRLSEDQLEVIKGACAVPHAAAAFANAKQCLTDEEGLATIA